MDEHLMLAAPLTAVGRGHQVCHLGQMGLAVVGRPLVLVRLGLVAHLSVVRAVYAVETKASGVNALMADALMAETLMVETYVFGVLEAVVSVVTHWMRSFLAGHLVG